MSDKPTPAAEPAFTSVTVAPAGAGFAVRLDAKPLKSPAGAEIVAPTAAFAEAMADELRATGGRIKAAAVPLVRVAGTAVDRIARHRAAIERQIVDHAETELVCHRADGPAELVTRQNATWQPLLDWLAHRHDALLAATTGVVAMPQSPDSIAALRKAVAALDDWRLAALSIAVAASGSLVVGLALADGRLDAQGAFDACELDATFQIERWGEDAEATRRRAEILADLELAERVFKLLR